MKYFFLSILVLCSMFIVNGQEKSLQFIYRQTENYANKSKFPIIDFPDSSIVTNNILINQDSISKCWQYVPEEIGNVPLRGKIQPPFVNKNTIYKDFTNGKILFEFSGLRGKVENFNDTLQNFKWKILPESQTIDSFKCSKASTSFRGRNYIAWFTTKVPLSDGPWKFSGLPGLIIELYDEQNQVSFKLISIKYIQSEKIVLPHADLWFKDFKIKYNERIKKMEEMLNKRENVNDPNCPTCGDSKKKITVHSIENIQE